MGVGKSGSTGEGRSGLDSFSSYMGDGKRQARRREGRRDWDRQAETETDRPELHRWWPGTRQPWSEGRTDRQRLGQRQTDLSCTGGGQAPGRPDLKEELKRGPGQEDGHTDPGCTGHGQRRVGGREGGRWDRGRETGSGGRQGGCTGWADVSRAGPRPEARDRDRTGDGEKHGSRDGASRSDADSGSVPGENEGEGRTRGCGTRGSRDGSLGGGRRRQAAPGGREEREGLRVRQRDRERLRHRDRVRERLVSLHFYRYNRSGGCRPETPPARGPQ